ncbi:MAG: TonB-dependent receptor [Sulfurimonas sp.]|nr:TonB-dependent receptor [Sulfurimonas sp.]
MYITKVLILLTLILSSLVAEDLENLLDDLNEYSNKNHLNVDYKPTAMTVLYASDLKVLGVNTLGEALDFVPGIQYIKTTSFSSVVSVRGYTQPLNAFNEKIKYRFNGLSVNSNFFENFPIDLIEKIEISKGSALTLHDQGAFVAVIDVITKDKNSLSFGTGSFNNRNFALVLSEQLSDDWKLRFDINYLKHDKTVDAPSAVLTSSADFGTTFDREQESLEGVEDLGFGFSLENGGFKFSSRYVTYKKQNIYGFTGFLDFNDEGYTKYETLANELSYSTHITDKNKLEVKLGSFQNNYKFNSYLYKLEPNPYGIYDPHYQVDFTQRESYLSLLIKNSTFENHAIEYGVYGASVDIPTNNYYANVDNLSGFGLYIPAYYSYFPIQEELQTFSGDEGFINNNKTRTNLSYFLSDTYSFSRDLSFFANVGIDDYEGYERGVNLKFTAVYSNDETNIYKFTLSQVTRAPSLIERFIVGHMLISANSELEAEKLQSSELMYVYQQNDERLKLNLFYQKYIDAIDGRLKDYTFQYYNKEEDDENYGIELEYSRNFENRSKLLLNASYNAFLYKNKENFDLDINTPMISKETITLGYIYPLSSKLTLSSLSRYYGSKEVLGENPSIDPVTLFDLGTQYNISKDVKLYFNVKNIFDTEYFYWGFNTKDETMLREGRIWHASLRYDF